MRTAVGVELTATMARAVVVGRRGAVAGSAEVLVGGRSAREVIGELRRALGPAQRAALTIGFTNLHFTVAILPPIDARSRLMILATEADRFFPLSEAVAVASLADDGAPEGQLACAAPAALVEEWVSALSEWAPVRHVDAAPRSIATVVGAGRSGSFQIHDGEEGESHLVTVNHGAVVDARRGLRQIPAGAIALPSVDGIAPRFVPALGAARAARGPARQEAAQLLTPAMATQARHRRQRELVTAAVMFVVALLFAVAGIDVARSRVQHRLEEEILATKTRAAPALARQALLGELDAQLDAAAHGGRGTDALGILASLSERLPRSVSLLAVSVEGTKWRIEGRADNAAAVVPALDADRRLRAVHLAGPTTRFVEGSRAFDSFAVEFEVADVP